MPKATADEVSTGDLFYDGSNNLGVTNVECDLLSATPPDCVKNGKCGWCGDKNSCIPGTSRGPLAPCLKNSFVFNNNDGKWNPLKASTVNIITDGVIEKTAAPDMSLVTTSAYN